RVFSGGGDSTWRVVTCSGRPNRGSGASARHSIFLITHSRSVRWWTRPIAELDKRRVCKGQTCHAPGSICWSVGELVPIIRWRGGSSSARTYSEEREHEAHVPSRLYAR